MAITSKTRKELWAKSGNRCAICKKELVNQISEDDGSFIIGDECHIISSSTDGPRYKPGIEDYDSYDNLLLLCKNHHHFLYQQKILMKLWNFLLQENGIQCMIKKMQKVNQEFLH